MSCEVKGCVSNQQIHHYDLLNVDCSQNTSPKSILKLPPVKKCTHCCPLNINYIIILLFWLVNSAWSVHISLLIQMRRLTEKAILWIEDLFEVKTVLMNLFLTLFHFFLTKPLMLDVNWYTRVVWITCDVFISCLDSHSDGTHSVQRIHWRASDVKLRFDEETSSTTSCMARGRVTIFLFGGQILL